MEGNRTMPQASSVLGMEVMTRKSSGPRRHYLSSHDSRKGAAWGQAANALSIIEMGRPSREAWAMEPCMLQFCNKFSNRWLPAKGCASFQEGGAGCGPHSFRVYSYESP